MPNLNKLALYVVCGEANLLLQSMEGTDSVSLGKTIIFAAVNQHLGCRPFMHEVGRVHSVFKE